ncbi:MAG: ATP-binding cassette domain-containing protein, partial [Rhodobacteraceae bacterium]|nr:ATP-binding cassette domain-containing protein [Paracoccaceae bacterium]
MDSDAARRREALAKHAVNAGNVRATAANLPVELNEASVAWYVHRGALDVAVAEFSEGEIRSPYKHILRVEPGHLAFGIDRAVQSDGFKLIGRGIADSLLYRIPVPSLLEETRHAAEGMALAGALVDDVDAWITAFAAAVSREVSLRPPSVQQIRPGLEDGDLSVGILVARQGVVWVCREALDAAFLETENALPDGPGLMPATPEAWIRLYDRKGAYCRSSSELEVGTLTGRALPEFHRLALGAEAINRRLMLVDEANLQVAHASQRQRDETVARQRLFDLSGRRAKASVASEQMLEAALQAIGRHEGIKIRVPAVGMEERLTLGKIVRASEVRARRVRLSTEDRWWLGDSGAMLAFRREDDQPLALLPGANGRYKVVDSVAGTTKQADNSTSQELAEYAWLLYRSLPNDRSADLRHLAAVGGGGYLARDLTRLALAGFGAGILALAPAVGVNLLVGAVIPSGNQANLLQLAAVLVGLSFAAALLQMFRGTALMRLEGRVTARISAAIWDRLLRLPSQFFRNYTAGDLASRALAFQTLRDQVSGAVADALLSVIFLMPMFLLLFYYDTALGWLTLVLGLATLTFTTVIVRLLLAPQRRYLAAMRTIAGELFQFIKGIGKLRTTGAESSAYAAWARKYREQKEAQIRIAALNEHVMAFSAAAPALAGSALFAVALGRGSEGLASADFLAVYTASMVFYLSVVRLGQSLQAVASIIPSFEQVSDIVGARTDTHSPRGKWVTIQGGISFQRISFRYSKGGPMVLQDVSVHVNPGEFVAIVGESGGGKSTLFRIALGLEEPLSGAVYYDGKNLAHLDRDAVRGQIGVVSQDDRLQSGNVLTNIVGEAHELGVDDAWRAARQAAVDRDIAGFPMQMLTSVGENASTFSGGQVQRIRIASALIHNPRILLLDEPTSWLDTKSQAETMEGIEKSVNTRIVIAHRLSTIRKADRIYVLRDGRVAQVGGFDEL